MNALRGWWADQTPAGRRRRMCGRLRRGVFVPDADAHERHYAAAGVLAHPPFHRWETNTTPRGVVTTCVFCGVPRQVPQAVRRISDGPVTGWCWAIVDTAGGELWAGPYYTNEQLRAALPLYRRTHITPAAFDFSPEEFRLMRHDPTAARYLLQSGTYDHAPAAVPA